jgi:hypothetical protein
MSMAPTTEPESTTSDLGQRFFLLAVFAILLVETVTTVTNVGQWFEWSSCLLGIVSGVGILYLGNWLYTGDKTALTVTRIWAVLQLALVLAAIGIAVSGSPPDSPFPRQVGVNALWEGILKLIVYLGLAGLLFLPSPTLDFFSAQRGETPASAAASAKAETVAAGSPVELAPEHTKALEGLSGTMKAVSGLLLTVGVVDLLIGLLAVDNAPPVRVLGIVEGLALAALGAVLVAPTKALQSLLGATPRNMGFVMNFFTTLLGTFKAYVLIFLVLAVVAVCRLIFNAT